MCSCNACTNRTAYLLAWTYLVCKTYLKRIVFKRDGHKGGGGVLDSQGCVGVGIIYSSAHEIFLIFVKMQHILKWQINPTLAPHPKPTTHATPSMLSMLSMSSKSLATWLCPPGDMWTARPLPFIT